VWAWPALSLVVRVGLLRCVRLRAHCFKDERRLYHRICVVGRFNPGPHGRGSLAPQPVDGRGVRRRAGDVVDVPAPAAGPITSHSPRRLSAVSTKAHFWVPTGTRAAVMVRPRQDGPSPQVRTRRPDDPTTRRPDDPTTYWRNGGSMSRMETQWMNTRWDASGSVATVAGGKWRLASPSGEGHRPEGLESPMLATGLHRGAPDPTLGHTGCHRRPGPGPLQTGEGSSHVYRRSVH